MKKLACKDINPSTSCAYVAEGENALDVAGKMLSHAKLEHPDDIANMNMSDDEIVNNFESKVHD